MSYDLMVFEPDTVPGSHDEFLDWYARETKWGEDHGYDDPANTSDRLRAWYEDISQIFPPISRSNGTQPLPDDEGSTTDYAIGTNFIYASFTWSKAEPAYMTVARLAEKYQLGLFNASSTGEEVWIPEGGRMKLAHDKGPPTLAGRIKSFLNMD